VKIVVLGAGAMGSMFGGHLARAGHEVTLVDPWREHMEAVAAHGLRLERPGQAPLHARPAATVDPALAPEADLLLVLTKGYAIAEAAESITHAVHAGTWIVTVQNGLGNDRALAAVFGPDRVVPGTTTTGAEMVGPGVVAMSEMTAEGTAVTQIGSPRGAPSLPDGVVAVAAAFTDAGLATQAVEDPDVVIWTKLGMAACIGPVTAAIRRTIGDVWESPEGRALIEAMFAEVIAVAQAERVSVDPIALWDHLVYTLDRVGPHHTSMAVDIMSGRRTEVESFCLEVARRGRAHGLDMPICETIGRLVKVVETSPEPELHQHANQREKITR
jgi:2-dehydropantoate 2-reductase